MKGAMQNREEEIFFGSDLRGLSGALNDTKDHLAI